MKTDLQKAYNALTAKQTAVAGLWAYYDGDHPLEYSTERPANDRDVTQVCFKPYGSELVVEYCCDARGIASDLRRVRYGLSTLQSTSRGRIG